MHTGGLEKKNVVSVADRVATEIHCPLEGLDPCGYSPINLHWAYSVSRHMFKRGRG